MTTTAVEVQLQVLLLQPVDALVRPPPLQCCHLDEPVETAEPHPGRPLGKHELEEAIIGEVSAVDDREAVSLRREIRKSVLARYRGEIDNRVRVGRRLAGDDLFNQVKVNMTFIWAFEKRLLLLVLGADPGRKFEIVDSLEVVVR